MRQLAIFSLLFIMSASFCTSCKEANSTALSTEIAEATTVTKVKPQTTGVQPKQVSQVNKPATASEPVASFPFDIELKDIEGNIHKSEEVFKANGKPTVLLFWLTTCAPCHMKLNAIKPLYPQWKEEADFNVFAISGDFPKNYEKFVKQTKTKNWEWATYNDVNRGFRDVLPGKLNGYPQTFIFDKDGKLVYQDRKYRPGDEHKLFTKIKEICQS